MDGFQGGQRAYVVVSTVRTRSDAGFLKDGRRINVAMTRAQYRRWVFGDEDALRSSHTDLLYYLKSLDESCRTPTLTSIESAMAR